METIKDLKECIYKLIGEFVAFYCKVAKIPETKNYCSRFVSVDSVH